MVFEASFRIFDQYRDNQRAALKSGENVMMYHNASCSKPAPGAAPSVPTLSTLFLIRIEITKRPANA
jgi:hypothetical protein